MLYLEDYLELIEHLPQELRDRLTLIRENDLKVNNACSQIDATAKQFFAEAKNSNLEQRQCDYEKILKEYEKTIGYADEKVQLSDQTYEIMIKLIERLDGELEKFKLELEAAALSSAITPATQSSISFSNLMDSPSIQNNKISTNTSGKGIRDLLGSTSPLVRQDPLAVAASQAIAATQQLHQGRRTSSLKASFAAVNRAGGLTPDSIYCKESRNALAPMASDQQAFRFNQHHYGKLKSNGSSGPLYVSVTKSGRPSKRPKHHASHLYPIESPPSISSDNSVFDNSESMSSADFIDAGNIFGSVSPSSFDFHNGSRTFSEQSDAGNGTLYHQPDQTKYCICQQISYGEMVACDNEDCVREWFHYGCVGISNSPKGKWFCPDCKQKMSSNQQHHNGSGQQSQTHKKRGRKEIL